MGVSPINTANRIKQGQNISAFHTDGDSSTPGMREIKGIAKQPTIINSAKNTSTRNSGLKRLTRAICFLLLVQEKVIDSIVERICGQF